jgi:hypothetical protein
MEITANNYRTYYQNLINQRASFEIYQVSLTDMISICGELEEYFLNKRYGILSAVFILVHNILTWSPDYEISRDIANNWLRVYYIK